MLLRCLMVENLRCFTEPTSLGPFGDRLNVVHGPNGTGKSSLMTALVRAMFDRHNSTSEAISQLAPWGRDLNPAITIEFEHDGDAYRLTKKFLKGKTCLLERREDGDRYVPLAEAKAAADRVREFLLAEEPRRGAAQQKEWGLAQVFWVAQQGMPIDGLSDGVQNAIHRALETRVELAGQSEELARIEEAYLEVFTPTGRPKSGAGAPLAMREKEIAALRQRRTELAAKLEAFENAGRRVEDLSHRLTAIRQSQGQCEVDLQRAQDRFEEFRKLNAECDRLQKESDAARATYQQRKDRIDAVNEAGKQADALRRRIEQLESELPAADKEIVAIEQACDQAKHRLDALATQEKELIAAENVAKQAREFVQWREKRDQLRDRADKIERTSDRIETLRKERASIGAPDEKQLETIEALIRKCDALRTKWDASLVHVELVPESPAILRVEKADAVESGGDKHHALDDACPLEPDVPLKLKGASGVAFRIEGVGTFRAAGPVASAETIKQELDEAERLAQEAAAPFGGLDLPSLRKTHARAVAVQQELKHEQAILNDRLENASRDQWHERLTEAEAAYEHLATLQPEWIGKHPDAEQLLDSAQRARTQWQRELREAEALLKIEEQRLAASRQSHATLATRLDETRAQALVAAENLQRLEQDGKTPAERQAELDELALAHHASGLQHKESLARRDAIEGDPTDEVEMLRKREEQLANEISELLDRLNRQRWELEQLSAEAPYTRLAETEETLARLEREQATESRRNEALRLLRDTVTECRGHLVAELLAPVERRARAYLERIAGSRLGPISLGEDFLAGAVKPSVSEDEVAIAQLSGGEREQVHFAVRLALADILRKDRTLLVLDDAFIASDASRLARVQRILLEATDRFQILVFTCHPERYRDLPDARMFDLEQLRTA